MQLTLDNKTKDQVAIERLQQYEPKEGYYLAFSGGKDSTCIYHLALKAGVKFDAHYSVTGIDPPELVRHIKTYYPDVKFEMPKESIWRMIERKGLPTRRARWCCQLLKEKGGVGRFVITGIRHEESTRRANRTMIQIEKRKSFIHPIIDWNLIDVWGFIDDNKLPYCELYDTTFDRIGCIGCPLSSNQLHEFKLYPKIMGAWHRATLRCFDKRKDLHTISRFKSGEEMWRWWLSKERIDHFIGEGMDRLL